MSCLGVSFALTDDEIALIKSLETDEARAFQIREVLEETIYDTDRAQDTDKAWCGIHVCLTNPLFKEHFPDAPLEQVIMGGEQLHIGDEYIISLCSAETVQALAKILPEITEAEMNAAYAMIEPDYLGIPGGEDDQEYTWVYFEDLVPFWLHAAERGHHVLFSADQ